MADDPQAQPGPGDGLVVDVLVDAPVWDAFDGVVPRLIHAVQAAASASGIPLQPGAEVSILLADDEMVRGLNRQWRKIDKPTNVLSFPACTAAELPRARLIGDIALACQTIVREAESEGRSMMDHLTHLAVHGMLHLLGYDHETDDEAVRMEALETVVLASLGVADPYADSRETTGGGATSRGAGGQSLTDPPCGGQS